MEYANSLTLDQVTQNAKADDLNLSTYRNHNDWKYAFWKFWNRFILTTFTNYNSILFITINANKKITKNEQNLINLNKKYDALLSQYKMDRHF